jgi:predicted esterase
VRAQIKRDQTILLPEPPESGNYPLLIALHGRNGNKDADLEHWEVARQKGWLVLAVQSTQPLFSGSYCWDDSALGLADLCSYYEEISRKFQIDLKRIVIGGFSQGSGMGIYAALTGKIPACGFIGIGTFIDEPERLTLFASQAGSVRGYFIVGEKDHTLETTRAIQKILKENDIQFDEEVHLELGHEFPADFEASFDKAIKFIFTEQE